MEQGVGFCGRTPRPARPAVIAAIVVLVVGLGTFVVLTVVESLTLGVSPATAIFDPGPGSPLFLLFFVVPAILIQGAIAFALSHPAAGLRVAGTVGAFAIAGFCLIWLVAVGVDVFAWLLTGGLPGDIYDLLAMVIFGVPFALAVGLLNARAGVLAARDLARHHAAPLAR
jgi:hypothetical protein